VLTDKAFHAAVNAAKRLKAEAVIAPLTGPLASLKTRAKEARQAKLTMLFENVFVSIEASLEMMRALHPTAALAFNPANFAAAGELPFLGGFRKLKRYVGYLAITDASRLGAPCVPGCGNGEVKELISILRCSSFKGCFSLGAAPSAALAFDDISDAFYRLLDAC
jgi:sugar phosphate isomerase/epimerase